MRFIGGFFKFARRVMDTAKKGGLSVADLKKLDNLLIRTGKRNTVLAKGILSALTAGGSSDADVERFGNLLKNAEDKISNEQEPFTNSERTELSEIFDRAYISSKTTRWFSLQMDELLAEEIKEFIDGTRRVDMGVPTKKTVKFEENQNFEQKKTEKNKKARL
jgi:hypothetical protein